MGPEPGESTSIHPGLMSMSISTVHVLIAGLRVCGFADPCAEAREEGAVWAYKIRALTFLFFFSCATILSYPEPLPPRSLHPTQT